MRDVTTTDSGSFDDASFEDRTTAEQVGLDDDQGSPRPPTKVPGVWKQMPLVVRILMVALVLVAGGAIWALSRQSLASSSNLAGGTIVELIPTDGSNIVQQDQIGIVLKTGYTTRLTVNGTAIPVGQMKTVNYSGQTQYTFQPGPGQVFSRWPAGKSCVAATYWRVQDGPVHASSQDWCFTVV
jgi:hypothetical protein